MAIDLGSGAPSIEIEDLDVDRGGKPVLKGMSLAVAPGRVTGLLGPSGSGKTTLMRSVVGVQKTKGGSVRVLGEHRCRRGSGSHPDRPGPRCDHPAPPHGLSHAEHS